MPSSQRIVFMGTPDFAAGSLKLLHEQNFNIVGVVTAPDRPSGRGQKIRQSAVKVLSLDLDLPVLQPEKLKDPGFLDSLRKWAPDLILVVAFRMLPEAVWTMPPNGTINLHASLLPQYRGAAPINWAIINGENTTGITTFFINKSIDTGHILLQEQVTIGDEMTAGDLHDVLMSKGAGLLAETVRQLFDKAIQATPQNQIDSEVAIKLAPKLNKANCKIHWGQSNKLIFNHIRGLSPYPGAWTTVSESNGSSFFVKIIRSRISHSQLPLQTGEITIDEEKKLIIGTHDGNLEILQLQPEGKKKMSTDDFLRGYRGKLIAAN